jgi:hypothetical protein
MDRQGCGVAYASCLPCDRIRAAFIGCVNVTGSRMLSWKETGYQPRKEIKGVTLGEPKDRL